MANRSLIIQPGQYLAVYIREASLENQEIRQYSLTAGPNGKTYRIAVKREEEGPGVKLPA